MNATASLAISISFGPNTRSVHVRELPPYRRRARWSRRSRIGIASRSNSLTRRPTVGCSSSCATRKPGHSAYVRSPCWKSVPWRRRASSIERCCYGEQSVGERIQQRVPPSVYVLLSDYSIVRRPPEQPRMPRLVIPDGSRFIPLVEDAIRKKTADWHGNPDARIPASLAIPPILIASIIPLLNGEEYRIGVVIDRYSKRNALNAAAMRFNLSLRELEVIALL